MAIRGKVVPQLSDRFAALLPHLNERQRRLALAVEARLLGRGDCGASREGQRDHGAPRGGGVSRRHQALA
jgi:hypothetical protein